MADGATRGAMMTDETAPAWATRALAAILGLLALRWAFLAFEAPPLHFDEAQYWTYGETLDFGYYSKPPLAAWLIRASSEVFGDGPFGVRFFSPLLHAWIAWLLFATGRRLFDAQTGFWAALAYSTLPGVTWSAALMTTDPPMMAAWAAALYALARAIETRPDDGPGDGRARFGWWALAGLAVGMGMLAKYTMVAFLGGALGYALFSREGGWRAGRWSIAGPLVMLVFAAAAWGPNLWWNAQNGFAAIAHVGDNTRLGGGLSLSPVNAAEFFGAQIGIFGPFLMLGLGLAALSSAARREWSYRLLLWLSLPLILTMVLMAFLTRAHPNWAAPAYVAGSLVAAAALLDRDARRWLIGSVAIGAVAIVVLVGAAGLYELRAQQLPRLYDLAKKMRPYPPVCARALEFDPNAMFLSSDRRILAICLNAAGRSLEDGARMFHPPTSAAGNHYALSAPLTDADAGRTFLFVAMWPEATARSITGFFAEAEVLESGEIRTHADRVEPYVIVRVSGFLGYDHRGDE